ncbi:hypothetical protein GCM10009557_30970 [Virgisporangium ochraceum]|uniref:Uncharacterized protein n=1 Tax=Virgisporangium ochraceum TaxID=65505 RepID=A0A8J4A834_9ACTN|nr:hypothetical protein Voc01_099970 [Virgisporangium ochraceum]
MRRMHTFPVIGPGTERAGILILRAWVEENSTERLRVRITQTTKGRESRVAGAGTVEDACQAVRNWLATLLEASNSSG